MLNLVDFPVYKRVVLFVLTYVTLMLSIHFYFNVLGSFITKKTIWYPLQDIEMYFLTFYLVFFLEVLMHFGEIYFKEFSARFCMFFTLYFFGLVLVYVPTLISLTYFKLGRVWTIENLYIDYAVLVFVLLGTCAVKFAILGDILDFDKSFIPTYQLVFLLIILNIVVASLFFDKEVFSYRILAHKL
jgi:hypothetical protein